MNKDIKKGTKVRIISDKYGICHKGEEYAIKGRFNGEGWELEEETWFYLRDDHRGIRWEVVQPVYKWESKFNIGDIVVWRYGAQEYYIITEIIFPEHGIIYVLDGGVYAKEGELSLYKEEPIKEMTIKEIQEELGYKIKVVE